MRATPNEKKEFARHSSRNTKYITVYEKPWLLNFASEASSPRKVKLGGYAGKSANLAWHNVQPWHLSWKSIKWSAWNKRSTTHLPTFKWFPFSTSQRNQLNQLDGEMCNKPSPTGFSLSALRQSQYPPKPLGTLNRVQGTVLRGKEY